MYNLVATKLSDSDDRVPDKDVITFHGTGSYKDLQNALLSNRRVSAFEAKPYQTVMRMRSDTADFPRAIKSLMVTYPPHRIPS